ncbi:unnamed protein product, partial [Allacma fusca]
FISTPPTVLPGQKDEQLQLTRVERTKADDNSLGIYTELPDDDTTVEQPDHAEGNEETAKEQDLHDEVLQFTTNCP